MTKVIYIIDGLYSGGKERQLVEIIKGLPKAKFEIGFVTFNKNQHYTECVKNSVNYFKELKKRPFRLEPLFTIWKSFHEFKPDIVHTWDSLSSFYSYLPSKIFRCKFIDGSIRDAGIEKGWELFLKSFFIKRADLAIGNSCAGLKYYNSIGEVIYNAIDLNRFKKTEDINQFNIIMTANFTDYKDHLTFFKAAIKLVIDNIVDNVYLAGDGPHKDKYLNMVSSYEVDNRFHFLGTINNVEDYLVKCKVGILCSTLQFKEGLSNSILEYMAGGLISVATNIGGTSEIIKDGINGFLFEPGNIEQLYDFVVKIKMNQYNTQEIRENAEKTIKEKFSYKENIDKLIKIYSELCIDN